MPSRDVGVHQAKYTAISGSSGQRMPLSAKNTRLHAPSLRIKSRHVIHGVHACTSFLEIRPEQVSLADTSIFFVVENYRARKNLPRPALPSSCLHFLDVDLETLGDTWTGTTRCPVEVNPHQTLEADPPESPKIEAIKVHHLVPGRHKVLDKLRLRVRASVDLGQGAQLGV